MKTIPIAVILATFISACGSPPKPGMPSGARALVNSPKAIEDYRASVSAARQTKAEADAVTAKLATTRQQLDDLQAYQMAVVLTEVNNRERGVPIKRAPQVSDMGREVSVTHVFYFDSGKRGLAPPSAQQASDIDAAARKARHVMVRGYTDSAVRTAVSAPDNAVAWLVKRGVDRTRIFGVPQEAGEFAHDNDTPDGRRFNRRVEMEFVF
jgi:outer membrane protein OmpA-like peptidoglycan-associated protein